MTPTTNQRRIVKIGLPGRRLRYVAPPAPIEATAT